MTIFNPLIDEKGEDFAVSGIPCRGYFSDIKQKKRISFQLPEFPLDDGAIVTRARDGVKFRVTSTELRKNSDGLALSFAAEVKELTSH